MSRSDFAVCTVCGKTYKTCLSCKNLDAAKPWRSITDTVECYKLFLVLSQYNNKHITKEEARKKLASISYNKKDLKDSVRDNVTEILAAEAAKKIVSKTNAQKCE